MIHPNTTTGGSAFPSSTRTNEGACLRAARRLLSFTDTNLFCTVLCHSCCSQAVFANSSAVHSAFLTVAFKCDQTLFDSPFAFLQPQLIGLRASSSCLICAILQSPVNSGCFDSKERKGTQTQMSAPRCVPVYLSRTETLNQTFILASSNGPYFICRVILQRL